MGNKNMGNKNCMTSEKSAAARWSVACASKAIFLSAALIAGGSAQADDSATTAPAGKNSELYPIKQRFIEWMLTDQKFVDKVVESGRAEIELSQLALQKSSNAKIKAFAQKMVDDHSKVSLEIKEIAQGRGLKVPLEMDGEHAKAQKKLQSLDGAAFDAHYIDLMVEDHEKNISLFTAAGADKKLDAQLQSFAQKTLPALREHLTHARTLGAP